MTEVIQPNDKEIIDCGHFSLRIDSVGELRSMIDCSANKLNLAAEDFGSSETLLRHSWLDYSASENGKSISVSGFVGFDHLEYELWSQAQVLEALYAYLVEEAEIDEDRIDEAEAHSAGRISVLTDESTWIDIEYDVRNPHDSKETLPLLTINMNIPTRLNEEDRYHTVAQAMQVWGELHDFVLWITHEVNKDEARGTATSAFSHEIQIKRELHNDASFVLWQALLDYEQWRNEIGDYRMPRVDHSNLDLGRAGLMLTSLRRSDYEQIYPRIQSAAAQLASRPNSTLSSGELFLSLST